MVKAGCLAQVALYRPFSENGCIKVYVKFLIFVFVRPLSAPHDLIQLMGRGGRGPTVFRSSLEVIWNNSDLGGNVPGIL